MIVDLVLETGVAFGVGAGLTLQNDGAAVRKNEPGPYEENARLTEGDLAVVDADELRALWNEQIAAGWAVVNILGDLGRDLAGQVRTDPGQQGGRDHRARLDDVFRGGTLEMLPAHGAFVDRSVQKGELAILHVLDRISVDRRPLALAFNCSVDPLWCRNRWRRCSGHRRRSGEQPTRAGSLGLLRDPLLFGIDAKPILVLRVKERTAEISREWRT